MLTGEGYGRDAIRDIFYARYLVRDRRHIVIAQDFGKDNLDGRNRLCLPIGQTMTQDLYEAATMGSTECM